MNLQFQYEKLKIILSGNHVHRGKYFEILIVFEKSDYILHSVTYYRTYLFQLCMIFFTHDDDEILIKCDEVQTMILKYWEFVNKEKSVAVDSIINGLTLT